MLNIYRLVFFIFIWTLPAIGFSETITKGNVTKLELAMLQKMAGSNLQNFITIDGLWGPATRSTLEEFSNRNNLPMNAEAMLAELKKRNIEQRSTISNRELLEVIRAKVSYDFLDPFSSKLRNVYWSNGNICGEINAKNAYGAYTGFNKFSLDRGALTLINADIAINRAMKLKTKEDKYSKIELKFMFEKYLTEVRQITFLDDPDLDLRSRVSWIYNPCVLTLKKDIYVGADAIDDLEALYSQ